MHGTQYRVKKEKFLGLRWKSFFWLSLLLLSLSSAFYFLNHNALVAQFRARQEAEVNSLRHHVQGLFSGTSDRLMRLGGGIATMLSLGETLRHGSAEQIAKIVSSYASLGYELDLRRIEIYSTEASLMGRWAQSDAKQLPEKFYRDAIDKVKKEERPMVLLQCQPHCLLYAFVPILASGENVGFIVLGQSIADFIIDFKLVTGTDIALAVPGDSNGGKELVNWGIRLPALTDAVKFMPLVRKLSEHFPEPAELDGGQFFSWNQENYAIYRIRLNEIMPAQPGFVLLISDISRQLKEIETAMKQGLLMTIASLLVAELMLLYLLRMPLKRLSQLALTLPLLAEGAYSQARDYFLLRRKNKRFQDEIDFLYESAIQLSHQLEQNSLSLALKNRELAEERDFIRGLLASAQVMVVTQTKQGVIRVGNDFVAQMTGYTPDQLYGQRFVDLIADIDARRDVQHQLQSICNGDLRQMEHEHELVSKKGERRKVVWVHTPLHEEYSDGSALLSVGMDITERVRAESRMRWLANHDPLTSLVNRHRFIEDLSRIFEEVTRTEGIAALLVFDLDHFKEINDTSGHAAGDALLRMIADEMKSRARKSDIVARLGGDEFAMLMPQTDRYGAETFAKQLNDRLTSSPFIYGEKHYRVGASIGIAFLPQHGKDIQEILANADLAMFEAKRTGRSRHCVFSAELKQTQALTQNVYWKEVLNDALKNDQFLFYFQPILDATTGRTIYCEALLRLRMPDGRIALPGEFLPPAERAGLSYAIDCYVVERVLEILSEAPDNRLFVNLSSAAFNDSNWIRSLADAVDRGRVASGRMIFEITETAVIADIEKAKQIIKDVMALGFAFAVDDFGAGFSSLYYLKHLPVEFVKIDQSLISGMANEDSDRDFVKAIISMIQVYGRKVIGEGVENEKTLELLKQMNVDFVQGYFTGYPTGNTRPVASPEDQIDQSLCS